MGENPPWYAGTVKNKKSHYNEKTFEKITSQFKNLVGALSHSCTEVLSA